MEESKKAKVNRKDYWLFKGIVVKVVTDQLGEKFNKQKGVVEVSIHLGGWALLFELSRSMYNYEIY